MMQLFITLFLVFILLSGYICQTITSQISLPSVSGKALAALETASNSVSRSGEWVMEGYNPQRNRATTARITPPLRLAQELMLWQKTPVGSPVVVTNDSLLLEGTHYLLVLTYAGEEQWSVPVRSSFLSPAVTGKTVFIRAEAGAEGYLLALQAHTGEKIWQFKFPQVGSPYDNMGGHGTSPVVVDGMVLVGTSQSFYALKAETGQVAWSFPTHDRVSSSAAIAGETVFFTDFGQLYAVDLKTGTERWQFAPEDESLARLFAPVVNGEQLITSSGSTVYALDRFSGAELWSFEATNFVSLPAITEEHLYVVTRAGGQAQLRALDQTNGQEIWQVEEGRLSNTAPVIANEKVYVRTVDGSILIYESGKVEGLSWRTLESH